MVEILQDAEFEFWPCGKMKYARIGAGFDIETTNVIKSHTTRSGHKIYDFIGAFAYHFQFALGDNIFLLRTWADILRLFDILREYGDQHTLTFLIWIANAGFEFQFMRRRLPITDCFCKDSRKPLRFRSGHLEFRDCLALSGGDLEYLANTYTRTKKLKGDLDYSIPRNSQTPLTLIEEQYCINDVVILTEFSDYCIKTYIDNGKNIPLTFTSVARQKIKDVAFETPARRKKIEHVVQKVMFSPTRPRYLTDMTYLFRGAWTHGNAWTLNRDIPDVYGVDIRSSYPAVMLQCTYPMGKFVQCEIQCDGRQITQSLDDKCYIFIAEFEGLRQTTNHCLESISKVICEPLEPPALPEDVSDTEKFKILSRSIEEEKRKMYHGIMAFNGRISTTFDGRKVKVYLTELDYKNYCLFYTWDAMHIIYSQSAPRGKLPAYLLNPLRDLYRKKDNLKAAGAAAKTHPNYQQYEIIKKQINSFYGMCCTRIKFVVDFYDKDNQIWSRKKADKKFDTMKKDFILSPYWGIYISAWARHRLAIAIHMIDFDKKHNDVIYYDTDSIYFRNFDNMKKIRTFNEAVNELNEEFHGLGCFDVIDGSPYRRFKTIGSKRYIKEHSSGKVEAVIAGLDGEAYVRKYGAAAFENFSLNGFALADFESCKKASFYVDGKELDGDISYTITDEHGNTETMHELDCIVIANADFSLDKLALARIRSYIYDYIRGT